ncbi:hypothetical protein DY000_02049638 [Brassica cretica]|uniref:F-box domain-containing protein n=1 Tax=Brassica cretica TaxID=69181 RepID=A0ABQ7F379_BRACR|nr:hypothetical protein DY000_02049638 [Brassica cretica]
MELLEEILSRVPVKSIVTVRSTCKNWNVLTEDQRFANMHIEKAAAASQREKEVLVITGDPNDNSINVKFYDFHNKTFDPSTKRNGILITQENSYSEVVLHRSFYCNGLLLCLWRNVKLRLLVWNPYWGKTRWINCPTKHSYHCEVFAFGYDKSCRTHKILWLSRDDNMNIYIDIYDLSCGLWKTPPDVAFHSNVIEYTKASLTLKGNTYWHVESGDGFLHCFDFTRERFGPHLPLPSDINHRCSVSLSSVKEEKLAVLLEQTLGEFEIAVWVTNKIEPDYVSWSKFFKFENLQLKCCYLFGNFLIEEEKKTVEAFDDFNNWYNTYIIDGESGHSREVDSTKSSHPRLYNIVSNYVPSSVQI